MQLNSTAQIESPTGSIKKITIANDYLKQLQRRFALATILIPFIVSVLAIGLFRLSDVGGVAIGLLLSMYALTMVGITVGFHRYFAHSAFRTNIAIRIILAILGSMAAQGPVIHWVSNHRCHHQCSDRPGDAHSPQVYEGQKFAQLRGLWYSHIGWMLNSEVTNSAIFARDLLQDTAIAKINQLYLAWVILGLAIPAFLGGILTATWTGVLQGFLWGGLVRIFLAHHATWSINSITHLYGNRPFDTRDKSTNNIWLAIPTVGEAWHNNHHAFSSSAKFGLKWWQVDLGYYVIRVMGLLGLAWDVKAPTAGMIEAKKATYD